MTSRNSPRKRATKPAQAQKIKPPRARSRTRPGWTRGWERALFLGNFTDSAHKPVVTDVDIAVLFSDVRGFTAFCDALQRQSLDRKIQHFLQEYFSVYADSALEVIDIYDAQPGKEQEAIEAEVQRLLVPTTYKHLGDGMMIVWDLSGATLPRVHGLATRAIVSITEHIQHNFTERFVKERGPVELDAYSEHVQQLRLGCGLARGHAWRLDFGRLHNYDYSGSIVNLAFRLQSKCARPGGIVAQYDFSQSLFDIYVKEHNGYLAEVKNPKGKPRDSVQVWASNDVARSSLSFL